MKDAYPLSWPAGWPRSLNQVRSRFGDWNNKPTVAKASDKLLHELNLMAPRAEVIISTNLKIKRDGYPYSGQAEPRDTGVAIYFKFKDKDMTLACDTFDKVGCNLWAIALTIEAMRGIQRWGCSELLDRAFTGFVALPEAAGASSWALILGVKENDSIETIKTAYRNLAKKFHPDNGTDPNAEEFSRVADAYKQAEKIKG